MPPHDVTSQHRKAAMLFSLSCATLIGLCSLSFYTAQSKNDRNSNLRIPAFPTPTPTPAPTPVTITVVPEILDESSSGEMKLTELSSAMFGSPDADCDGIRNELDNCPLAYNPDQKDSNRNGSGNACDGKLKGRMRIGCDEDGDGVPDYRDNCVLVCNPGQEDKNKNGAGDVCDPALLKSWPRINPCQKQISNFPRGTKR